MITEMKIKKECAVCPTKIWTVVGMKLKKSEEYNEVDVRLNNDSKMTVGVCSKHTKPKRLELEMITEKNMQGWLEEVAFGIGNEAWVKDQGINLKVVGVA